MEMGTLRQRHQRTTSRSEGEWCA